MESISRQPDLNRLLYQSPVAGSSPGAKSTALESAGHGGQTAAATVLTPEKADASMSGEREEVQIKLVDKLQAVTSPVEAAAIGGETTLALDATSQLEEAGAALDIAQRRALLLGRTKQRHVCLQCGRECPSKHKLKRHLSTHSEQRPYNCHLCGKSFKWTEYLAKHMRTQHPGVEVPAIVAHGVTTSSSPGRDCLSPPTPSHPHTSTSSPSPSLTPSHSQLTPTGSRSLEVSIVDGLVDSSGTGSEIKDGITVGSAPLGMTDSPIGCDSAYSSVSHLGSSPASGTTLLAKPGSPPLTSDLLQTTSQSQQQQAQIQQQQQSTSSTQQSTQLHQQQQNQVQMVHHQQQQQQQDILQQLQQQQQQKQQKEQQQQLLQQQIQQHQLQQQQLQQQQQTISQQVLQQKQQHQQHQQQQHQQQQTLHQLPQQVIQQQTSQSLLQVTEMQSSSLQTQSMLGTTTATPEQQMYNTTSASCSPSSQTSLAVTDSSATTQMSGPGGGGGGGGIQVTHPLSHVMNTEAAVVQSMGYVGQGGEAYEQTPSTSVVYTTDTYHQDPSSSSQAFNSPVYISQGVSQVYQIPPQPQSTLSPDGFTDSFPSSATNSAAGGYITTLASLSQAGQSQQQGGGGGGQLHQPGMDYTTASSHQQPITTQGGGTNGGGLGGGMEQMSTATQSSQEPNILHMQAQIAQSAYELQSVQMQSNVMSSSMQTYDSSAMMQPSGAFQDASATTYTEGTGTFQEEAAAYQTGAGTRAYQGTGYQEGTAYASQTHAHQTMSSLAVGSAFTDADGLGVGDSSQQMYSATATHTQSFKQQQDQHMVQQLGLASGNSDGSASYTGQVTASDAHLATGVYGSLGGGGGPEAFHQAPHVQSLGGGGGGGVDQRQQQQQGGMEKMLDAPGASAVLQAVQEVETVITMQSQPEENPPTSLTLSSVASESANHAASEGGGEKTTKKSQKPKVSVGIQCEVGPETFRAMKEEEAQSRLTNSGTSATNSVLETIELDSSSSSSLLQKPLGSSLLLNNSGSSPVTADVLNVSSPDGGSGNTSGGERLFTGASDKVIRKYPCEMTTCAKAYVHRKDLIRHMTLRHGMSPQKLEPVVIETPEKPYTCQVGTCRKSYFHQKDLRRHQRQCHAVTDNSHLTGAVEMTDADGKVMVRFPCDFPGCQRSYVHKKDLVRHKRVYHKDDSKKPSIPVPVKFTEADLKRIRLEEKSFNEKEAPPGSKKPRLDSTGSIMSSGEDGGALHCSGSEINSLPLSEMVDVTQLSSSSVGANSPVSTLLEQSAVSGQVSGGEVLCSSSELQEITGDEQSQMQQLALSISQQQQQRQSTSPGVSEQINSSSSSSPTTQGAGGAHTTLPTILRRQRHGGGGSGGGSNGTTQSSQEQQQQQEQALRSLASLMFGGLQGTTPTSGSGAGFDLTQQMVTAFSASPLTNSESLSSQQDSQQTAAAAAVAQFDPAAIISALSNVVNNPDVLASSTPLSSLDQQQVVSMENVASALQYLTSTSSTTS